ncbi:hypothetical protein [Oligoflexus tunisiensis]|uniref:hypothetical protein n=1 Tax=Oligoflexus tunisiensis TaxID=708132 RepID=UPI00114D0012|nr:hypothetical protein [Oligoflexus tunisiensis]
MIHRKWEGILRIGTLIPFLSEPALARWNHHEADALNRVIGLGTEYYNDILSYRDPLSWERDAAQHALSYRGSAGSLNTKEFLFREEIRLRSSTEGERWQLAFQSDRDEEPRRILRNSALELSYGPEHERWRVGILGDGHTEKSFMDLGMQLKLVPFAGAHWQLVGWSVDTFYTAKRLRREDYRTKDPWTWELSLQQDWGRTQLHLQHEQDQPVIWYQVSRDRRYAFQHRATQLRWSWLSDADRELYFEFQEDAGRESLAALSEVNGRSYHDLRRIMEIGEVITKGQESYAYAVWGLWEGTRYEAFQTETTLMQEMRRQEIAGLWNWTKPFWNEQHTQHWGLVMNYVRLDEGKRKQATEIKVTWGPDFVLGKTGRLRLNTTWDLDQIAGDFPFTERRFHPWGGGQASFMMTF